MSVGDVVSVVVVVMIKDKGCHRNANCGLVKLLDIIQGEMLVKVG